MKNIIFILIFSLICQTCLSQSWNQNFTRVRIPQTKISTTAILETQSTNKDSVSTEIQYYDGLGRPMQTVGKEASPTGKDIVTIVKYDEFGREVKKYLPFAATVSDGTYTTNDEYTQLSFYSNSNNSSLKLPQDSKPFSTIVYDASPLNSVLQQFGPGESWNPGHAVISSYLLNSGSDVPMWIISGTTVSQSGSYSAGTLFKTQTTDENVNNSWEYKDMQGKVVLKQVESIQGTLSTHYVYDDFDRLAYVIPPKATKNSYSEADVNNNSADFNELIYGYKYDGKGRMTEKHIPGAGWVYMVYNNIDQPILSQDAKQHPDHTWIFSKYDALGRVVMTGSVVINDTLTNIQNSVNNETTLWETRDDNLTGSFCYTSSAFPLSTTSNYTVLTVNYYDTYGFDSSNPAYGQALGNPANSNMTTGLLTGSKVKILDDTNTWLSSVTYYDDKGRPLQVFSKNILNTWDRVTSLYDFTGKVLKGERIHDGLTITNRYVYDHAGRKKEVYSQLGSDAEVELAEYNYNELGQLVKKYLHGNGSSSHLQGINYRYNIRGWLTSINNAMLDNDGVLNDEDNSAFGEELSYNNSFAAGTTSGTDQYNGNISGMKWKSKDPVVVPSSIPVNAYAFQYDKLSRMTLADYGNGSSGSYSNNPGYYNEQLTYDVMGNILTLKRNCENNITPMDDLVYAYPDNSNKLSSVTDNSTNTRGFNDRNKSGNDYAYDASGNLTQDLNKGLTIGYNFLNLPKSVTRSDTTIGYTYDATGRKLKKTFPGQQDHYYIDGIEYDGSSLLFAMTEEGRVRPKGDGTYTYDYFLKDHLGNIRVVLNAIEGTQQPMVYPAATMETMSAATESTYYSNLDKVRNVTPVGFTSLKKNEKVAHLKGTDPNKQIGPSITIKVNSGDKISLTAQSFYPDNTGSQRTGLAETALSQLVNAMINPAGLTDKGKAFATDNLKAQGFDKSSNYQNLMNKLPNSDYNNENNRPKAYMVWMLFDKEMKLVKTGQSSGARQIPEGAGQVKQMAESDIVMDQGGFLTAYTVNESPASVYIDNFQLSVVTGNVLEINDYYPFGMLNEGLSDPGLTSPLNYYKYNDKELQKELSLEWLDYGARFYDPQIGRWHSVDPLAEKYYNINPFTYCSNNPESKIDPDGMGDYYTTTGTWLGSDEKEDDLAYTATSVSKREIKDFLGNVVKQKMEFKNAQLLSVTNDVLNIFANTVAAESSGDEKESYAIASTIKNLSDYKDKDILGTIQTDGIYGYKDGGKSSAYNNNAKNSMGAVINALTGGIDYSGGALRWDGFDLAAKGFDHIKARSAGIDISKEDYNAFKKAWSDRLISAYSSGRYTQFSNNFNYGAHPATSGYNKGMTLYQSSGVLGRTIFWKPKYNRAFKGSY